jgi:hypothetical protein
LQDSDEDVFAWRLISSTGGYVGIIIFPIEFEPKWTDGRLMLGVLRDALGVATIQEYELVPPPALRVSAGAPTTSLSGGN